MTLQAPHNTENLDAAQRNRRQKRPYPPDNPHPTNYLQSFNTTPKNAAMPSLFDAAASQSLAQFEGCSEPLAGKMVLAEPEVGDAKCVGQQ